VEKHAAAHQPKKAPAAAETDLGDEPAGGVLPSPA
jgi:hypothetical protein